MQSRRNKDRTLTLHGEQAHTPDDEIGGPTIADERSPEPKTSDRLPPGQHLADFTSPQTPWKAQRYSYPGERPTGLMDSDGVVERRSHMLRALLPFPGAPSRKSS